MRKNSKQLTSLDLSNMEGPFSVAFTVTSKCNFYCRHCYNNSGDNIIKDMEDDLLIEVAHQIADLHPTSVCICGGEPLVRGDIIYDIIEILVQGCGVVNIVSNGYLVTEEVVLKLKKCGIKTLQISLDGDTPFLHDNMRMKQGAYENAVRSIEIASKNGLDVAVSFIPTKLNYKHFERTCELVRELGAKEVRTMPLITMGRGKSMKMFCLSADEYLEYQQMINRTREKCENKGFSVMWGDPIDHLYRMPENYKYSMNSYSMEIRADGKLTVSTYLPIVVGDVRKHTLKEYWFGGYNNIWGNEKVMALIGNIYSTEQFSEYNPEPYTGKDVAIDLLKE